MVRILFQIKDDFAKYLEPMLCWIRYQANIHKQGVYGSHEFPRLTWDSYDFKEQSYSRLLWFKSAKDHGNNYMRFKPLLVLQLLHSSLLKTADFSVWNYLSSLS